MSAASSAGALQNRTLLGLVLVAAGSALALNGEKFGAWWPLLLVGAGFVKVRLPREDGQRAAGVAFLMLGGLLQLTNMLAVRSSWPLLVVAAGAFLIWGGVKRDAPAVAVSESPWLSHMTLLGYLRYSRHSSELRGGSLTAVMGVMELDLRNASLASDATLDVVAFWGGIEIKVPDNWTVDAHVVPVMGAFQGKPAALSASGGPRLVLRGHAIMGAVIVGS